MTRELSKRQRIILKLIIQDYVETGRAVGSRSLLERYDLGVSAATVRNDMGELEERAYLQHPHTSAGRVPTDRGYRYYVEHLIDESRLPLTQQIMIQHQFRQVQMQLARSVKLAAALLAEASGNIAVITPPRGRSETIRHFEMISLREHSVLLIIVTQSGTVHESFLHVAEQIEQDTLSALSRKLNPDIRNRSAREIQQLAHDSEGLPAMVLQQIAEIMHDYERDQLGEMHTEGLDRALQQPEFAQNETTRQLLELMRGGTLLSVLTDQIDPNEDVQIFIGSENQTDNLQPFGIIIAHYGSAHDVTGMLGIVGPTRMPYDRSLSTIRYVRSTLSGLLSSVYDDPDKDLN